MKNFFDCNKPYIQKEYYDNIINYKYRSTDSSITYKYIISPLCNRLVKLFPKWVAPNLITVSGFFLNLCYFIVTAYYTKLKGGVVPPWACFFSAFCYLIYQILDNIDGKQARRTNSSSALGLLIDHGTDACTTFFITCGLGAILGLETIKQYMILWLMIIVPFYLNTWEQYISGEMSLPCINGINEGTFLIFFIECFIGFAGQDILIKNKVEIFGKMYQINTLLCISFCFSGIFFGLLSIIKILGMSRIHNKARTLLDIFPFIYFLSGFFAIVYLTQSKIVDQYPQLLIITFGFQFAKMLGLLQLSHLANKKFNPYNCTFVLPNLCFIIYSCAFYFLEVYKILFISIDDLILFFLVFNFFSWMHFVIYCSGELCVILGIYRFSLKKRSEQVSLEETETKIRNQNI